MMKIRKTTPEDFPKLKEILDCTPSDWSIKTLMDCFNPHYLHWVIEDNTIVTGFIVVKNNIDHADIMQIVIAQHAQNKKLGTALLTFTLQALKEIGISTVFLEVRKSNIAAIRLYEKLGFRKAGDRKHYYADKEDALIMLASV